MALVPSVGDTLRALFPDGTRLRTQTTQVDPESNDWPTDTKSGIEEAPFFPTDVFGAAAYLLERSGAYSHIVADFSTAEDEHTKCCYSNNIFVSSKFTINEYTQLGRRWRDDPDAQKEIQKIWDSLLTFSNEPLIKKLMEKDEAPQWWSHAYALMVASDEASTDIGYFLQRREADGPAPDWANAYYRIYLDGSVSKFNIKVGGTGEADPNHIGEHGPVSSLALVIDQFVARVLPKGRTSALGCTMRTLSHNLALLPGLGRGYAYWQQAATPPKEDEQPLNLLLIPFPYRIWPSSFVGEANKEPVMISNGAINRKMESWGRFKVKQDWLQSSSGDKLNNGELIDFFVAIIEEAQKDCKYIHGIILPEYTLNWSTYNQFATRLRDKFPNVEFLVSGTSEDCQQSYGNFVVSTVFSDLSDHLGGKSRVAVTRSRKKHHRWRLDSEQIRIYNLASSLDPFVTWWECLEIREREMHFTQVRRGSSFTTMICEDLARSDPAHGYLRALGPNLVFVLLMDGPQIPTRWPARYATTIADDPGSSVLTLTSYGLVERSNFNRSNPSHSIGLWRDDTGSTIELHCPQGNHGVLLTLSGKQADEITLDARPNDDSRAWQYHGHRVIRIPEKKMTEGNWGWIFE